MGRSGSLTILIHFIGWILFFSLIIGFVSTMRGGAYVFPQLLSTDYLFFYFTYIFLFYFNSEFLIPKFYLRKKYFLYFPIIAMLLVAVYLLQPFDDLLSHRSKPAHQEGFGNYTPPPPPVFGRPRPPPRFGGPRVDIISIILFGMIWSLSTVSRIIRQWRITERKIVRAEADKATAELSFLKAQVNPHFLFNTLNNIYALALTKDENTAVSIMKLSNIMRYVTDEIKTNYVSLQSEVTCVADYIDLHRLRLNKQVNINFLVEGNLENKQIAPLIFIPFIENVFKYGTSTHEKSDITTKLFTDENSIQFFCQNRILRRDQTTERAGIGITNTKQRLEHLYPGKHQLDITIKDGLYTVQLVLKV